MRTTVPLLVMLFAATTAWAVDYIDAYGYPQSVNATVLTGSEGYLGSDGTTTWYVVSNDISYTHSISCYGNVNIILTDGKTMSVSNNGVGIRTSEGVDAAYEGMEIQILDHDDPIYKGLREYQVHGSVYGIIPAKRIKHKPLGEWNYEEIRAEGDHITVTLNGEVLVDGNIREACQGHNMAPEAGQPNPYTVDHQSHPGLFNKEGLISFCGHGEGLKLRNIRVLDLTQKKGKR